jgi:predicted phage tail component-like protein
MLINGFTFNERHSDEFFMVTKKSRPMVPEIRHRKIDVEGRDGSYDLGTTVGSRLFEISVTLLSVSQNAFSALKREVASWLVTDDLKPLVFDDEPDKTYFVRFVGESTLNELFQFGEGTITFIAPDPFAYGAEETLPFSADGFLTYQNTANKDLFPNYTLTFNAPSTFFSIVSADKHITVGTPTTVEDTQITGDQIILSEGFNSLTGWTATNTVVDGEVSGTITVNAEGNFIPESYGTGTGWHGPALKKSLSESLQDFKMEVFLENKATGTPETIASKVGRTEIYLLDINDSVVGKFAIKDFTTNKETTYGEARLGGLSGGKHIINYAGNGLVWNQFDGYIYVERIGQQWVVRVGKYDHLTGRRYARLEQRYFDTNNDFSAKVAKVQVHFGAHSDKPFTHQLLDVMRVWKVNQPGTGEIESLFNADDVVEIDTGKKIIYKNGAPWMYDLNLTSEFFPFIKGDNTLKFVPADKATASVNLKQRWL